MSEAKPAPKLPPFADLLFYRSARTMTLLEHPDDWQPGPGSLMAAAAEFGMEPQRWPQKPGLHVITFVLVKRGWSFWCGRRTTKEEMVQVDAGEWRASVRGGTIDEDED